jgi:hypothetical protein
VTNNKILRRLVFVRRIESSEKEQIHTVAENVLVNCTFKSGAETEICFKIDL